MKLTGRPPAMKDLADAWVKYWFVDDEMDRMLIIDDNLRAAICGTSELIDFGVIPRGLEAKTTTDEETVVKDVQILSLQEELAKKEERIAHLKHLLAVELERDEK